MNVVVLCVELSIVFKLKSIKIRESISIAPRIGQHRQSFTVTDSLLQSFPRTCIGDVTLLGAPLFAGPSLDRAWSDRCAELARASCRLSQVEAKEALILLRGFFSAPKVLYRSSIQLCRNLSSYCGWLWSVSSTRP